MLSTKSYVDHREGLILQEDADMLRISQLHKIAHSEHAPSLSGNAMPHVPKKFLLSMHRVPNYLAVTLGVLPLLAGTPLI